MDLSAQTILFNFKQVLLYIKSHYPMFPELTSALLQVYVVVDHVSAEVGRWRPTTAAIRQPMIGCTKTP